MPDSLRCLAAATLIFAPAAASAQAQQPSPRCDTPAHRQFDFWVGDWIVMAGSDTAGPNLVTLAEDGCVLHEDWVGSKRGTGQSFNFPDRAHRSSRSTHTP